MKSSQGQFNTFQLNPDQRKPGPTVSLEKPFDKSSKKPRPPPKFLASSAIAKVNLKLNSVEHTLKTYMPYVSRLINDDFTKKSRVGSASRNISTSSEYIESIENRSRNDLSAALRINNSKYPSLPKQHVNFVDYRQILIPHYFLVEEYCKFPRLIELPEFFDCFRNNAPPDFLMSAIIADGSLTSPHKELHMKNLIFYEYHYRLSLIQMMPYLSKPSLHLIQALLVLWDSDRYIGRFIRGSERMTSAIRLAQTLNFHEVNDTSSILYRRYNEAQINTIRRIWNIMCFTDTKISQVLNGPSLLPAYEYRNHQSKVKYRSYYDQPIIIQSMSKLPCYYHTFLIQCPKLASVLTGLSKTILETTAPKNFNQVEKILLPLDDWYNRLPPNIKYDTTCLLIKNRSSDPMNSMRIIAYLIVLNGKLLVLRHIISYDEVNSENLNLKFKCIESLMKVCNEQLKLMQDWFKLSGDEVDYLDDDDDDDDNDNDDNDQKNISSYNRRITPPFPIEYFYELGLCYLQMLKTLNKIQTEGLSNRKRKWKWKSVDHEYNNLFELINHFSPNWEGSDRVVSNFDCWYKKIETDISLPKPILLVDMDRFIPSK